MNQMTDTKNMNEVIQEVISHLSFFYTDNLKMSLFKPTVDKCHILQTENSIKIYPKFVKEFGGKFDGLEHPSYHKFCFDTFIKKTKQKISNIMIEFDQKTLTTICSFVVDKNLKISIFLIPVE